MGYEPEVDAVIALRDGRRIAYCEWGDRDGRPLILCHGAPASRFFGPDSDTTAQAGVRLITVDRPGYGRSDPKPGRQILDWPADVEELAAALGVDEFDVAGHSSGGPYALACASRFPERVKRVALVSCIAPYSLPSSEQGDDDDELTRLARKDLGQAADHSPGPLRGWLRLRSFSSTCHVRNRTGSSWRIQPSAACSPEPSGRQSSRESMRTVGIARWSVDLGAFRSTRSTPQVWIFQGEQDRALEPSQAHILAAKLPGSRLRFFPDAGHGLILGQWSEILGDLRIGSQAPKVPGLD